jgi:hypothetical protein
MNIKQIGALLGGAVLMALAGSAGAGVLYNGNASGVNGTAGSYNVVIYENSIFDFHVNTVASNANPLSTPNATQIRLYFFTGLNGTGTEIQSVATLMGGTNAGVWNNWGLSHAGNGYDMYTGQASTAINGAGSNQFQQQAGGYFNLANGNAHSMEVELQKPGSNDTWIDTFNITDFVVPETSSYALLLPGLVPLGIALRRRAARQ